MPLPAQEPGGASLEGKQVATVRVVTDAGTVLEENPPSIVLQPGAAYSSEAVRDSLRQLYRSGRFADVRAEAAEVPGGVRLDFVVRENFYVNIVHVEGLRPPPGGAVALSSLRLSLGQTFRESDMPEALERLKQALANEGFYQAQAAYSVSPNPATRQMDITVRVTPGPRAVIGAITASNQTGFSDAEMLRRAKLQSGWTVKTERLDHAAERVRKFLVKQSHLGARAIFRRGEFDAQTNSVPVTLDVSAGPRVRVEVTGASISKGELRKLLPIYEEGAVDEDLLQEGRRNIRDFLERQGYFDSDVRYHVTLDPEHGQQAINYIVERGPRRRLVGIAFEGNESFSSELLLEQLRLLPAGFLSRGRFSQRLLQDDEEALRELYIANGFREAKVQGEVLENYAKKEGDLFVRFRIAEGPQTLVANLTIEGNLNIPDDEVLGQVNSTRCQPYSEFNSVGDRDNLLAVYYNEGFPEARFEFAAEEANDARTELRGCPALRQAGKSFQAVRLTYRINEGPQITVKNVLLSGYRFTRPHAIQREVQITPGDPLREGDVIETQRRLYNLGIFSRVSIAPQNPAGTEPAKTLVVQVEEARRYTVAYGGGIEVQRLGSSGTDPATTELRASPSGLFEITRANVLGRAHTAAFKVRASTLQSRALLSYAVPSYFGRRNFSLLLTGLADRTTDVRTFSSRRFEASVQLAQTATPITSILYRYSFRRVLVGDLKVSQESVPLFSQPTKISSFGVSWIRDRRDNPANASKGNFNTMDVSVAGRTIGSSASFFRFFAQNSSFHPLGRVLVFARSLRIGIEKPLGETAPLEIPLPERFFAGGGTSLRGLGLNQAGPRDPITGFPIGGLAMLLFNQELRFPMRLPFLRTQLGGAVFYDAGNVFCSAGRISFRWSPVVKNPDLTTANPCDREGINELRYLTHTIGLGFRYGTPVGPVRVDLGYQLNPARFQFCEDSMTSTTAGCPVGQAVRTARLPRFQFFFAIGPIF